MPADNKIHARKIKSARKGGKNSRIKRREKFGDKFEIPMVPSVRRKPMLAKKYGWL